MALTNPHAQGPNSLPSAIPGGNMADIMPSGSGVGSNPIQAPSAQMRAPAALSPSPAPQVTPQPQAQKSEAEQFENLDPKELASFEEGPPGGPPSPPKSEFDGKTVEGKFLGSKVRVTAEGVPEMWAPSKNSWIPLGDQQAGTFNKIAKGLYSAFSSLPDTAGNMAASVIPGEGLALSAARVGVAGAVAATGRATGLSAGISNYILSKMYNPKDLYILKKIAGYENEPSALQSGVVSAGGQVFGEVLGAVVNKLAGSSAEGALENAQLADTLKTAQPLEQAAKEAGIPIRGTQIASQLPGGSDAANMEARMANGSMGSFIRQQTEQANQNQAKAIGASVDNLIKKVAPNVDFDNMDISKISGAGGQRLTFLDRINETERQVLATNRASVGELARDRQFDPTQVLKTFESSLSNLAQFQKGLVKPDGSIDPQTLMALAKSEGYSQQSLGDFARSYLTLKNLSAREAGDLALKKPNYYSGSVFPEAASNSASTQVQPSMGIPGSPGMSGPLGVPGQSGGPLGSEVRNEFGYQPNLPGRTSGYDKASALLPVNIGGEAQGGITFKQLSSYVDHLQDLAFQSDGKSQFSRAMIKAASAAKGMEDDVTAQMFQENGQPHMADRIIQKKEDYASVINEMNSLSSAISQNPDNAAKTIFNVPSQSLKKIIPMLSDNQRQEVAGSLLTNAAYNEISKSAASSMIDGINADAIKQSFFGTSEARAKTEMIFGETAPDLEGILNVAKVIQNNSKMSASQQSAAGGKIAQMAAKLVDKKFPLTKLGVLLNAFTDGKPEAKDLINASLSDLIVKQEQLASKSIRKASALDYANQYKVKAPVKAAIGGAGNASGGFLWSLISPSKQNENSQ